MMDTVAIPSKVQAYQRGSCEFLKSWTASVYLHSVQMWIGDHWEKYVPNHCILSSPSHQEEVPEYLVQSAMRRTYTNCA